MSKIKQQFIDLKKSTPKHIQWLLLAAAFVVVLILLTLLFSSDKKSKLPDTDTVVAELKIAPDAVDWSNVIVGDKKQTTIKVSANTQVKIQDVRWHKAVDGFGFTDTCRRVQTVNTKTECVIDATYEPTVASDTELATIFIDWYDAAKSDQMSQTSKIVFTLSAKNPEPTVVVAPAETEPEPEQYDETEEEIETVAEPISVQDEIKKDIESIAPEFEIPETPVTPSIPEACSDFAFPGYDNYGRQIGWIKPEAGSYKFHPFSDINCNKATGVYNPDNGIITDINNSGKRIGSDAEHIGFNAVANGTLPELSNAPAVREVNRARQLTTDEIKEITGGVGKMGSIPLKKKVSDVSYGSSAGEENVVVSSQIYDRQFLLRQYKPIPATIVSDIRADIDALERGVPVRATVDRNVYSDSGRNIIIPTGTLLLGYVTGKVPGPYQTIGRMDINWYQFILPNGVEFNFLDGHDPYSGDSQGRIGVPGRGSTDYLEQFFMPMLTAFVPATINLINPIADAFVNQIDLDNNTVVQSGTMRSSELAKNEIITAWNQVAQKLMVDMMDNTVPPFTIAAGTRITVYSPVDLMVTCGAPLSEENPNGSDKKCAVKKYGDNPRRSITKEDMGLEKANDASWVGQARSFQMDGLCDRDSDGLYRAPEECFSAEGATTTSKSGYSCLTLKLYCESLNYQSKKALQYEAYRNEQQQQYANQYEGATTYNEEKKKYEVKDADAYNEMIGVSYDADGNIENPYDKQTQPVEEVITCFDGSLPDVNGCCAGEIYTDMGDQGFNCCPETGGDCFPPIVVN